MSRAQQTGELQNGTQSMGSTYGQRNFDRQQAPPVAASVGDVGRKGDLQTASGGRYTAPRQILLEAAGDGGQDHVGQGSSEAGPDPANVGVGELASNQAPAPSHRTVEWQGQRRQRGVRHHLVQSQEGGAYLFARELHRSVKQILSGQRPVLDPLGHSPAGAETGREHVAVAVALAVAVAVALAVDGRPLTRKICDLRAAVEQDLEEIAGAQSVRRGEVRLDEQGVSVGVEAGQEVNFPERSPRIERLAESGVECRRRVLGASYLDVRFGLEAHRAPAGSADWRRVHTEPEAGKIAEAVDLLEEFPRLDPPFDSCQAADVKSRAVTFQVPEERAVRRQRCVRRRHGVDSPAAGWRLRKRASRRYASGLAARPL